MLCALFYICFFFSSFFLCFKPLFDPLRSAHILCQPPRPENLALLGPKFHFYFQLPLFLKKCWKAEMLFKLADTFFQLGSPVTCLQINFLVLDIILCRLVLRGSPALQYEEIWMSQSQIRWFSTPVYCCLLLYSSVLWQNARHSSWESAHRLIQPI